jgi:hypothetical protein
MVVSQRDRQFRPGPGAGEYSWGPGLVPPGCEDLPPSEGGMYSGKTPRSESDGGLNALAEAAARRRGDIP